MKYIYLIIIGAYQIFISPIFKQVFGVSCRYDQTCSEYAKQMFTRYTFLTAARKTAWRLLHCQPFTNTYEYL